MENSDAIYPLQLFKHFNTQRNLISSMFLWMLPKAPKPSEKCSVQDYIPRKLTSKTFLTKCVHGRLEKFMTITIAAYSLLIIDII